jgi:hypothetical protein
MLPEDMVIRELPEPVSYQGPDGLHFARECSVASDQEPAVVETRMTVNIPYMIPAERYAEVKLFYEKLEREADIRLAFRGGAQ